MNTEIEIVKVESQNVVGVRKVANMSELPTVIPSALDEVYKFLQENYKNKTGHNIAIYLDEKFTVDIGVIALEKLETKGDIFFSATPSGMAVHTTHIGPYNGLPQTHSLLRKWCKDNNVSITLPCWEIYDHWTEDESKLRTDVYYLIRENN